MTITEPTALYDLDEAEYHADKLTPERSLSSTMAKTIISPGGPARLREIMLNGQPRKPEWDFGSAAHQRILGRGQPVTAIEGDRRKKETRDAIADAEANGSLVVKPEELEATERMAEAILAHPLASELLTAGQGKPEVSMFGLDQATGRWLRGRLDFLHSRQLIVDYKGLAIDTPIPTPTGWTLMADLRPGDQVLDSQGRPCTVMHKSETHWRQCYRMEFDDGSSVICDDEHRWVTSTRGGSGAEPPVVKTARQIKATIRKYGQRHHRIAIAHPLDLPDAELAVDPYVLGCWLGDGSRGTGRISKPDDELFERIEARGYKVGQAPPSTIDRGCPTRTVYGLSTGLREVGVLHARRIPSEYLRASYRQRLDLLRGLMDTDGSWNDVRTQAVFCTSDLRLAEQVRELALSLGERAIVVTYTARGFGKVITAYRVTFRPVRQNPFAMSRKADRVRIAPTIESTTRIVRDVQPVPTVPTQCIEVDSPDRTYLCGEAMIPTHNTTASANPRDFERSAWNFGYHIQAAHYLSLAYALDLIDADAEYLLVAQEKRPPYLPHVYRISDELLDHGRQDVARAIALWDRCMSLDDWPGLPHEPTTLTPPRWADLNQGEEA